MAEKTFKIGDTVKVTARGEYYEKTGEIIGMEIGQDHYTVRFYHNESVISYRSASLELAEPAPKFRLGDVVHYIDSLGFVSTETGVITEQRLHPFQGVSPNLAFFTYKVKFPNLRPIEYSEDKLVPVNSFTGGSEIGRAEGNSPQILNAPKTIKIANGTTVRIVKGKTRDTFVLPKLGHTGRVVSSKENGEGVMVYEVLFLGEKHYFYVLDELEMVMTTLSSETVVEQETIKHSYTYEFLNGLSREELSQIKNKELDRIRYNEKLKQETIAQILQYQQADILSDLTKKDCVSDG